MTSRLEGGDVFSFRGIVQRELMTSRLEGGDDSLFRGR